MNATPFYLYMLRGPRNEYITIATAWEAPLPFCPGYPVWRMLKFNLRDERQRATASAIQRQIDLEGYARVLC